MRLWQKPIVDRQKRRCARAKIYSGRSLVHDEGPLFNTIQKNPSQTAATDSLGDAFAAGVHEKVICASLAQVTTDQGRRVRSTFGGDHDDREPSRVGSQGG